MKNTLEETNSRLDKAEDRISDRKDKVAENTQSEQKTEKKIFLMKWFKGLLGQHEVQQHLYHSCMRRKREQGIENFFEEIMTQ